MFGLIATIFVGFIVGVIAKLIMPGKENIGLIMTTILGVVGAPRCDFRRTSDRLVSGRPGRWIGSIVGAFVVLWGYMKFKSNA